MVGPNACPEADLGSCERGEGGGGVRGGPKSSEGERCKLPQRVLGRSLSRHPISCSLEKNCVLQCVHCGFLVLHMEKWPIHRRSSCFFFQIEFQTRL